ncbi:insulinase family protein [Sphingomonas sp. RB56-2]|uniref:Insulinase family protein n=1 Tax=Sphingomonas brevis TaxID=2908206 RepID=A0ABT0S6M4_9SPHN|nr:M16 family metallopeptidase [Sphingomonas brevis]MCL6740026.1 insulinase family protein [Sphingomonas brevis]
MLKRLATFAILAALGAAPAFAKLDLSRADISRLPNGLTVMILEDHTFPVVSVQALYMSGGRDEVAGKTGLAHFLEHLAFRASKYFPNGAATEAIYDGGGEWHGYTWIDQTTYFATMPRDGLDLLLRIEADRMARVTIDPAAIAAEKGAVITEMHGYENDPASVLLDVVTATAFQAHPYRNNTIGYESDVEALTLDDARAFYDQHYVPANAVLAIAGDVDPTAAKALVARYFQAIPARSAPTHRSTAEPQQLGERQTLLSGPVSRQYFTIAYPAPAASNADVPPFLLLQQLVGGGSGLNFRQNDWGTAAEAGSLLHGVAGDLATWFTPSADRYIFTIRGSLDPGTDRASILAEIARRLESLRQRPPSPEQLAEAKRNVLRQLEADVETTEDAAHQLAFMAGIGAYDMLVHLADRVQAVSAEDIRRVATAYLDPMLRTVGWYVPGKATHQDDLGASAAAAPTPQQAGSGTDEIAASPPAVRELHSGLPVVFLPNPRTDGLTVKLLMTAPVEGESSPAELPGLGLIERSGSRDQFADLIAKVRTAANLPVAAAEVGGNDPDEMLEGMIASAMRLQRPATALPLMLAVSGSVEPALVTPEPERALGGLAPAKMPRPIPFTPQGRAAESVMTTDLPFAQGAVGYVVPAPPPASREGLAWRMLLYVLAHDYSGRLGRSAIADKGLTYFIDGSYRTNGRSSWICIKSGVDSDKADAFVEELRRQLAFLASQPPTDAEIDAARRHILGRDISAAQSNDELADRLVRQFVESGAIRSHSQLEAALGTVTRRDILSAIDAFRRGTLLRVDAKR